jgi:hypothetical protein
MLFLASLLQHMPAFVLCCQIFRGKTKPARAALMLIQKDMPEKTVPKAIFT